MLRTHAREVVCLMLRTHAREVVGVKSPIWSEIVLWSSSIQIQLGLGVESGAPVYLSRALGVLFIHRQMANP